MCMKTIYSFLLLVGVVLIMPQAAPAQNIGTKDTEVNRGKQFMPKALLQSLVGAWEGTCRTWFEPDKLADESRISDKIIPLFDGRFFRHEYQGTIQGRARRGEELIAYNAITNRFQIVWIDDFHMNYAIMFSEGEKTPHSFVVHGKYDTAPDAPQ